MALVSFTFLLFVIVILCIYYLVPGKLQWVVLLASSILFYALSTTPATFLYVLISVISIYLATRHIDQVDKKIVATTDDKLKYKLKKSRKRAYLGALILCVGMLAALKYMNFFLGNIRMLASLWGKGTVIPEVHWLAALGISFYTLQMVGYLTDVYWGISKYQKNIAKLALFNCYFPQMISGPISRYHELESSLFDVHRFDFKRIYMGGVRVLIGFFKKLVIAEHLLRVTDAMFANPAECSGIFVWIAMALYVIEIYADFSGCMDIIMGVSECFGVYLPENFKTPFCSVTIQEFWQRWHITLGTWLKDYIMYPILRSGLWNKYTKKLKKRWGKTVAKQLPVFSGMLILWLGMGLWHGGGWNYIGEGIWFWLVIVLGQILDPWFKKIEQQLKISTKSKMWYLFSCARTTLIYAVGALFFRAENLKQAFLLLKSAVSPIQLSNSAKQFIPVLLMVDESRGTTHLIWTMISVLVGLIIMIVWGKMERNGYSFRDRLAKRGIFANCLIIYILFFMILLLGAYGPGYSASEFIYGGF